MKKLGEFFEDYINKKSLFKDKKVLKSNYFPRNILHRKKEIETIARIMAPALKIEKPSNLFCYGKTGTGKTCVVKHITKQMMEIAEKKRIPLKMFYLNCKLERMADTEYRLVAELTRMMGSEVPTTGLPTKEIYDLFRKKIEEDKKLIIIILDEVDQLFVKTGDEILYTLTRLNSELKNSEISLIGISNDLTFTNYLDARVKSSLSEEEILFPPYNAIQLQTILKQRAKLAFNENNLNEGVIEKCAAYAAREHGDARRALELLRVAGELAERSNEEKITIKYLDLAEEKIDKDRLIEAVKTNPKQFKLTLYSILNLYNTNIPGKIFTGDIYEVYKKLSFKTGIRPLTQRRVSDIIAEMDMLGIIQTRVISKGRYGRTREIYIDIPPSTLKEIDAILKNGLNL